MRALRAVGSVLILAACATSGSREKVREAQHWISAEEVRETGMEDLFVIVRRLRPRWVSSQNVLVFQNQSPMGGLDALSGMDPGGVYALEWMPPFQAVAELPAVGYRGPEQFDGVIVVWTRPPGE